MGVLARIRKTIRAQFETPAAIPDGFDGGKQRRRLRSWQPTRNNVNAILSSSGDLLRARARDVLRNNPHAVAACDSFTANLIGTGIKPSSLLSDEPDVREEIMETWLQWTDECDADGIADFYGMQTIIARALFEAGECFIRYRSLMVSDGYVVPLQIQLLESDMCPYSFNQYALNGNYIMNGIELDYLGARAAYWFYPNHPGDMPIDAPAGSFQPVRIPASEVLHIFKCTRPGQMRGVPLITPALVRLFFLDQYDDAELERKRIAAMFAGFIVTPTPEDVIPIDGIDGSAPQENVGLSGLEPGTMQTLLPGEDIKFSEPAASADHMKPISTASNWRCSARWASLIRLAPATCGAPTTRRCADLLWNTGASSSKCSTTSSSFRCVGRSGSAGSTLPCWPRLCRLMRAYISLIRKTTKLPSGFHNATIGLIRSRTGRPRSSQWTQASSHAATS
jgi:capsid protein